MYDLSLRHIGPTPVLLAELSCLSSFNNTCLNSGSMLVLIPIFLKYEKHFPKLYGDVGMAVPKTTQTRYMDGSVQATQMTTQVTPSLHHFSFLLSTQISFQYSDNKA